VRRKRGNRKLICPQCGRRVHDIRAVYERKVRDLPCFEFQTAVVVECYRIRCPDCGVKAERNPQLPSKAPYSLTLQGFSSPSRGGCRLVGFNRMEERWRLLQCVRNLDFDSAGWIME